jgi:phosphoribosylamine--glycine ligase
VIGSGAREHALCTALAADAAVSELCCAPGNPGIAQIAELVPVDVADPDAITAVARNWRADFVVVGPELPLVAGAADAIRAAGIPCFGPSAAAARLEGSKAFAKQIMTAAGVPTAASRSCTSMAEATQALGEFGPPYVVKDDGLAAGKGVVVTTDRDVALNHAMACDRVVIEQYLDGPEVSLFVVTDGEAAVSLLPAQDFKRVGDDDSGPNTGGMGAYCPLPWLPAGFTEEIMETVVYPTLAEMHRVGTPFAGLLYVGLAITSVGPKVIEFNARFGDPEAEVVLPLLETPLAGLLYAAATGTLAEHPAARWSTESAVAVVLASRGYPTEPSTGDLIAGLARVSSASDSFVFHAGTARGDGDDLVTAGGRVLAVTGLGADLAQAREQAYRTVRAIELDGGHFRSDIAAKAAHGDLGIVLRNGAPAR